MLLLAGVSYDLTHADNGPHGGFTTPTTDSCSGCHRTHTSQESKLLMNTTSSLCESCHGSPPLHQLVGGQNYSTRMTSGAHRVSSSQICFTCHRYQTNVTEESTATHFPEHKKQMDNDWGVTCYSCHDSHGSEQLHLLNFDASAMTFLNGRNSHTA